MYLTKEKIVTLNAIKKLCMQARIGPPHFDKLKPESGPTRKSPTYNSDAAMMGNLNAFTWYLCGPQIFLQVTDIALDTLSGFRS